MVLNGPEIPPKVTGIVTLSGGAEGGPGKTTLSGRVGVKGKSDDVTLYEVGFFCPHPLEDFNSPLVE